MYIDRYIGLNFMIMLRDRWLVQGIRRTDCKVGLRDGFQRGKNLRVRLLEEASGKLVQQAPDIFSRVGENLRVMCIATPVQLDMLQRLLQCPCDV